MIVLDTNVVSEAMKPNPDPAVQRWLNQQLEETLYLSVITLAELKFGIAALPDGARKERLAAALQGSTALYRGRVLPFDEAAASRYAELAVGARTKGRGFPVPDGYIAAIAASRGFIVASRDTAPFEAGGLPVVNPWMVGG